MSIVTDLAKREEAKSLARTALAENISGAVVFSTGVYAYLEIDDPEWRKEVARDLLPRLVGLLSTYCDLVQRLMAESAGSVKEELKH